VQKRLRSPDLHINDHGHWNDFFQGGQGGNGTFFQVVTKNIFPRGATAVKFHFTNSKLGEKHFSTEKLMGKYQISKAHPAPPF